MKSKFFFFFLLIIILLPTGVFAADFIPLVGIPELSDLNEGGGLNSYVNALYRLSISIAALLAVIKIVAAGAKYMLSDIITHKEDAKKDIQGALIGLLVVIGAVIILNTVNSDLTKLDLKLDGVVLKDKKQFQPNVIRDQECKNGCVTRLCSNLTDLAENSGLPLTASCKQHCDALKGFFYKPSDSLQTTCAVSNEDYLNASKKVNAALIDKLCPSGKTCFVSSCKEEDLDGTRTCKDQCSDSITKIGYYSEKTKKCVIEGKTVSISCTNPDRSISGCTEAINNCENQNGTAIKTPGNKSVQCDIYTTRQQACSDSGDVWNNPSRTCFKQADVKTEICEAGFDCKIAACNVPDTFGLDESCSSWCAQDERLNDIGFTGGEYNEKYNLCYANVR